MFVGLVSFNVSIFVCFKLGWLNCKLIQLEVTKNNSDYTFKHNALDT